jgi:hypothetical protein
LWDGGGHGTGSDGLQDAKAGALGKTLTGAAFTGKGDLAYLAGSEHVMIGKQPAEVTISVGEPGSSCQQRLIEGLHHHSPVMSAPACDGSPGR